MQGETYGIEVWGDYKVNAWWRLSAGMNLQHENFHIVATANAIAQAFHDASIQETGDDPTHQASLRSSFTISRDVTFDADLREVGELPNPRIPAYVELGARLGWQVTDSLLASNRRLQPPPQPAPGVRRIPGATEVGRSFYTSLQWRF